MDFMFITTITKRVDALEESLNRIVERLDLFEKDISTINKRIDVVISEKIIKLLEEVKESNFQLVELLFTRVDNNFKFQEIDEALISLKEQLSKLNHSTLNDTKKHNE